MFRSQGLGFVVTIATSVLSVTASRAAGSDVSIDQFLTQIQTVLVKIRDSADVDALPELKSITVKMRAGLKREADGTLKFHVLEAGADVSDESVQEIDLELGPPQPADKSPVVASVLPLADAIINAARDVKKAATRDPPLHLRKLEASVEFTVEKEASGVLIFVGAKTGSKNVQKIVITFSELP